jgi:hypothetical protein
MTTIEAIGGAYIVPSFEAGRAVPLLPRASITARDDAMRVNPETR